MTNAPGESQLYRVIVTGWRSWPEDGKWFIWQTLDWLWQRVPHELAGELKPNSVMITEGECPYGGVDLWAKQWALSRQQQFIPFPADWERFGKAAGMKRNAAMVDAGADLCLGFPGPGSKGTWNCLSLATNAGIETHAKSWHERLRSRPS